MANTVSDYMKEFFDKQDFAGRRKITLFIPQITKSVPLTTKQVQDFLRHRMESQQKGIKSKFPYSIDTFTKDMIEISRRRVVHNSVQPVQTRRVAGTIAESIRNSVKSKDLVDVKTIMQMTGLTEAQVTKNIDHLIKKGQIFATGSPWKASTRFSMQPVNAHREVEKPVEKRSTSPSLFEVVGKTTSGRYLIKDEYGNHYIAEKAQVTTSAKVAVTNSHTEIVE